MSKLFVDFCPPHEGMGCVLISKKICCALLCILLTLGVRGDGVEVPSESHKLIATPLITPF